MLDELPQRFHELATMITLAGAAIWLVVHWLRIGKPRALGCARCVHGQAEARPISPHALRSRRLRVIS